MVYAIENGHVEIVDLLLKKYANRDGVFPNDQGAYPNIEGDKALVLSQENQYYKEGLRLADIAVSLDYEEVYELLKKRGFK